MPLSASTLRGLSSRFARRGIYDVGDSFAIAAACSVRGDFFGREVWIDTALEKLHQRGMSIPSVIQVSGLRDLAA